MRRTALLLAVLVLLAVACTSNKQAAAPPTTPATEAETTLPPTTTSTVKPTTTSSTVARTTTTVALSLGPGDASLGGTVSGPQGPVDGATVHIERLVGKSVASQDVTTSGGGSWQLPSILGGSYRVRAFKSPDLAQSDVQVFFLAATDHKTVDFKLAGAGGDKITAAINPNPARVGQPATLIITIGTGRVDDQGRPSITPRPGVVLALSGNQGYVVDSVPQTVTDGNGAAAWSVHCVVEGATSLALTVGGGVTSVNLPPCGSAPVVATTTTKAA